AAVLGLAAHGQLALPRVHEARLEHELSHLHAAVHDERLARAVVEDHADGARVALVHDAAHAEDALQRHAAAVHDLQPPALGADDAHVRLDAVRRAGLE